MNHHNDHHYDGWNVGLYVKILLSPVKYAEYISASRGTFFTETSVTGAQATQYQGW